MKRDNKLQLTNCLVFSSPPIAVRYVADCTVLCSSENYFQFSAAQYKLCVLGDQCVYGSAPTCRKNAIRLVAITKPRHCLQSASSTNLIVPATRRSTLGDGAFAVTGPRALNSLPDEICHSPSLAVFKHLLKTCVFTFKLSLTVFYSLFETALPRHFDFYTVPLK